MSFLKAIWAGIVGFFSPRNIGGLVMLFAAAVLIAYLGVTPDRVAAKIPTWDELTGSTA